MRPDSLGESQAAGNPECAVAADVRRRIFNRKERREHKEMVEGIRLDLSAIFALFAVKSASLRRRPRVESAFKSHPAPLKNGTMKRPFRRCLFLVLFLSL